MKTVHGVMEPGNQIIHLLNKELLTAEDFRATGDPAPGSILYRRADSPFDCGEIAVVLIDSEDGTLKRVVWRRELGVVQLAPANEKYATEIYPIDGVKIIGKAHGSFNF